MSYWIHTTIRLSEPVVDEILQKFGENGVLKFEKVIPIPEDLNFRISDDTIRALLLMYHAEEDGKKKKLIRDTIDQIQLPQLFYAFNEEMRQKALAGEVPSEEDRKTAEKCIKNFKKYHHISRYDTRDDLWGTEEEIKKGSFSATENTMSFITKYDTPLGIITYLSVLYSEVEFRIYVEEDNGDSYRLYMIDGEEPM